MSNHTPGPWFIKRPGVVAERSTGELVATLGYRARAGCSEEEDNAALIAAAPYLLSALRAPLDAQRKANIPEATTPALRTACQVARAALAQAEGK